MTAQEWLQRYDQDKDKFAIELAKVLTPEPWKHEWGVGGCFTFCRKCQVNMIDKPRESPCLIPNPIDINDWNVAMEWRGKIIDKYGCKVWSDAQTTIANITHPLPSLAEIDAGLEVVKAKAFYSDYAQPKHYLIAAAMAKEKQG